jgi:ferric-dicitrate binding protein FerR (iron transport regulator)
MNKNDVNDSTLSRLSEAADWLQRLHQCASDEVLLECQRWLDYAVENAEAFERIEVVWQAMGQLAAIASAQSAVVDTAASFGALTAMNGRRTRAKSQAKKPVVQSAVRRCSPATIAAVKPQLPFTIRISRPPARA